jgi:hypothetical protein
VLSTEFVHKGKDARVVYGNILLTVWEEFVEQKKMVEAIALSVQQKENDMKAADNPHHLGLGGYATKLAKLRQEEEESVNTKNWYRKGTDLRAEFGDEIPFGRKQSSQRIR